MVKHIFLLPVEEELGVMIVLLEDLVVEVEEQHRQTIILPCQVQLVLVVVAVVQALMTAAPQEQVDLALLSSHIPLDK